LGLVALGAMVACSSSTPPPAPAAVEVADGFSGSGSCRECHARFYELWEPSRHGRAMQTFSAALARDLLAAFGQEVTIAGVRWRFVLEGDHGFVETVGETPKRRHEVKHTLGGKNVFYLLTPTERGRLQVLPIAFDARLKEWFDTTQSAMRHFRDATDEAVDWTDPSLTFNTSCHGCHVSQLDVNYDLASDSYRTTWREPGINCETCHGAASEHVRVFRAARGGPPPEQLHLISDKDFSVEQTNDSCSSCHAKLMPLAPSFEPGGRYFDHFDLVTLESRDFYPDGRDLGENYTFTQWRRSPCVKGGRLDCMHCHTSSGRNRHAGDQANQACLPCHAARVAQVAEHSHHRADGPGGRCISCHMPETSFARMVRHDHSMRPPVPAATEAFGSPNACNICHQDQSPAWAERWTRRWLGKSHYAEEVLRRGRLVEAARKGDFEREDEMLAEILGQGRDEVLAVSLIRLLRPHESEAKRAALLQALQDGSPLVRGAAAEALGDHLDPPALAALVAATRDDYRLVRVRAAAALAGVPGEHLSPADRPAVTAAVAELEGALESRPDDPTAHYNLGNLKLQRGDVAGAATSFETASKLRPDFLAPLVNVSLAYSQLGHNDRAERALRRALALAPKNTAANLNLGLLLGELGRPEEAVSALRTALESDPENATATYNLGVLLADQDLQAAIGLCRRAQDLAPDQPRYAYTLGFYQNRSGDKKGAKSTLRRLIERHPSYGDAYFLLGALYEEEGRLPEARALYGQAADRLPPQAQGMLAARLQALAGR
jgi:tetratricopeptide (TPR) repeat protein